MKRRAVIPSRLNVSRSGETDLVDLAELRSGPPEHEGRAECHLEGPVH